LDTAIEPFLTTEEELARSGRQIADDYDWEAAFAEVRAEEDSQTPESPEESALPAASDSPEQPAETPLDATDTEIPVGGAFEGEPADVPPASSSAKSWFPSPRESIRNRPAKPCGRA